VITSLMPSSSYLPFFFHSVVAHPDLHSFPTRRSSDLAKLHRCYEQPGGCGGSAGRDDGSADNGSKRGRPGGGTGSPDAWGDRKQCRYFCGRRRNGRRRASAGGIKEKPPDWGYACMRIPNLRFWDREGRMDKWKKRFRSTEQTW